MRRVAIAIIMLASTILTPHARAEPEIFPSGYKLIVGTQASPTPLAEIEANDDVYNVIDSARSRHHQRVTFTATFLGVDPPGTMSVSYTGLAEPPCFLAPSVYHWRMKRFVSTNVAGGIPDNEVTIRGGVTHPRQYIRNGKVRARYTCTSDVPFTLSTDDVTLVI